LAMAPSRRMIPASLIMATLRVPYGALTQPFWSATGENPLADSANQAPSREVKHCALVNAPSAETVTCPLGWINSLPLVAPHRATGGYTRTVGRNAAGSVKAAPVVPLAIAPARRMMPASLVTAALRVAYGALVQPFCSATGVSAADSANDTPSSDVKHCAAEKSGASTLTAPEG